MTKNNYGSVVWSLKYRPTTINELVMSDEKKKFFETLISKNSPMNLLLSGPPGNGKTTTALAITNSLGADVLFLNGSGKDRGIDTVKQKVEIFARTRSLEGNRKIVIYDEADSITNDAQMALRSLIESVEKNCSFILTANYPSKIIEPLISRCHQIDLTMSKDKKILSGMAKYCVSILKEENIQFSKSAVISIVRDNFPDIRKMINSLQEFSLDGEITNEDAAKINSSSSSEFFRVLRSKKFSDMQVWILKNVINVEEILEMLWNNTAFITPKTLPYFVVHLDDAQDRMTRVANKHITLIALIAKIMADCEFVDD